MLGGCPQRHSPHCAVPNRGSGFSFSRSHGVGEGRAQPLQELAWGCSPGFVRFDAVPTKLPVTVPALVESAPGTLAHAWWGPNSWPSVFAVIGGFNSGDTLLSGQI